MRRFGCGCNDGLWEVCARHQDRKLFTTVSGASIGVASHLNTKHFADFAQIVVTHGMAEEIVAGNDVDRVLADYG